ncbi:MAG: hypothetical protein ABIO99_10470 [Candidatus Limnocylindria bacterium]
MKDIVYPPEKAAEEHVWQYEHEVLEDESDATIKVAEGTQVVGEDGKLYTAGQSLKVSGASARQHVAAGRAQAGRKPA